MTLKRKLGAIEIKQAIMADQRFRDMFPELKQDIDAIIKNPTCACNRAMLEKFFQFRDRLETYFPNRIIETVEETTTKLSKNNWKVINCHVNELENLLRKFAPTIRRQLAVARYQDQATVILNEIPELF